MRLVMKAYKYKLYNSKKNKYLVQQIEIASEIWTPRWFRSCLRALAPQCSMTWISADIVFSVFRSILS